LDVPLGSPDRPSWRGRLHVVALGSALPLLVVLAVQADGGRARAGTIIYGVGLCAMLAVSATYHRWVHTLRARAAWRRADHATIFAAIAGTFSALALTSVPAGPAIALLIVMWAAAVAGAILKATAFDRADRIGAVLYIVTGWAGLVLVPSVWRYSGLVPIAMLVAGGVAYTVGAVAFRRQWPRLRPATFSYHEVWHGFTLGAAGLHFAAIWIVAV
jgi:hemolysin III